MVVTQQKFGNHIGFVIKHTSDNKVVGRQWENKEPGLVIYSGNYIWSNNCFDTSPISEELFLQFYSVRDSLLAFK